MQIPIDVPDISYLQKNTKYQLTEKHSIFIKNEIFVIRDTKLIKKTN